MLTSKQLFILSTPLKTLFQKVTSFRKKATTSALQPPQAPTLKPFSLPPLKKSFPVPRSAYIHIPFCRRRCYYCDFPVIVTGDASLNSPTTVVPEEERYVDHLIKEIKTNVRLFKNGSDSGEQLMPLKTVYFGGGTPSLLSIPGLERILDVLHSGFGLMEDCEVTVEMDPGTFDKGKLVEFMKLGVNRVSVGVQGFEDDTLKRIGRAHGVGEVYEAVGLLKECGLKNWSMDLIASLPKVGEGEWKMAVEKAIKLDPPHLSVYDLQVEEETKFGRMKERGKLEDKGEDERTDALLWMWKQLKSSGWEHYEISSFAKNGNRSMHNQMYWRNESFFAFGLGATSFVEGYRFARPKRLKKYYDYVEMVSENEGIKASELFQCAKIDNNGYFEDFILNSLRFLHEGLDLEQLSETFGENARACVLEAIEKLSFQERGLIEFFEKNQRFRLCDPEGVLMENTVASGILESTVWR